MTKNTIYLDYAAATPLDPNVLNAMKPYLTDIFYNPSAPYQPARNVRNDVETARASVSNIIGVKPTEIIFTAGATESINLAFSLIGHIVTTTIEHVAILETVKSHGYTLVQVSEKGRVDLQDIKKAITPETTIVSVGLVNNETGTLQDIKSIANIVDQVRNERKETGNAMPIYLHTDASQAAGILNLHVARLGVDMMTLNGGKMYGPKQSGILYVDSSIQLQPLVYGGGQERGLRSGTENVSGIIGFAKALEIANKKRKAETEHLAGLRTQMLDILQNEFDDLIVIGDQKHCAPHILTVAWSDLDAERALFALEAQNILVATGSACAANKDTRSHVLTALGLAPQVIDGSLRFSFGRQTTSEEIDEAAKIIVTVIKQELTRGTKLQSV